MLMQNDRSDPSSMKICIYKLKFLFHLFAAVVNEIGHATTYGRLFTSSVCVCDDNTLAVHTACTCPRRNRLVLLAVVVLDRRSGPGGLLVMRRKKCCTHCVANQASSVVPDMLRSLVIYVAA